MSRIFFGAFFPYGCVGERKGSLTKLKVTDHMLFAQPRQLPQQHLACRDEHEIARSTTGVVGLSWYRHRMVYLNRSNKRPAASTTKVFPIRVS